MPAVGMACPQPHADPHRPDDARCPSHRLPAAADGHRHDGHLRLDRHEEAALLERQQLARAAARALREDQERVAGAQRCGALLERLERPAPVPAIDGHEAADVEHRPHQAESCGARPCTARAAAGAAPGTAPAGSTLLSWFEQKTTGRLDAADAGPTNRYRIPRQTPAPAPRRRGRAHTCPPSSETTMPTTRASGATISDVGQDGHVGGDRADRHHDGLQHAWKVSHAGLYKTKARTRCTRASCEPAAIWTGPVSDESTR